LFVLLIQVSTQRFTQSILYTKRAEKLETRQPISFKDILRKISPDISGKPLDLVKNHYAWHQWLKD